ncbi:MAG: hypothetical protein U1E65_29330 [Myxococcota bacterium]
MKLIDELVNRAEAADSAIGDIADKEMAAENRRKAYKQLESEFDSMAQDGYLDKAELDKLMADFRAQGLDTTALQDIARDLKGRDRVEVNTDLKDKIGNQLRDAELETRSAPSDALKTQLLMNQYQQSYDLASRVSKAENEIYMVAIRHLVA